MAIETAADLAGFFDTDEWAASATYAPVSGGSAAVSVILDQPVEALPGLQVPRSASRRVLRLRAAEVAAPVKGDVVTVGAEALVVQAVALDVSGLVWTLECRT